MKLTTIAAITLLTSINLFTSIPVYSHPHSPVSPGGTENLWMPKVDEISDEEPQASINPNLPVTIKLLNQTGKLIEYAEVDRYHQRLNPGEAAELHFSRSQRNYIASIFINTPSYTNPLIYDFHVVDNVVTVNIESTSASNPNQQRSIYIDGEGFVYAF